MNTTTTALEPLFTILSQSYTTLETTFFKIPGSAVVARYVKSSHQNDPGRTVLEVILIIFAIRTLMQSRTRADNSGKHFIKFEEKVRVSRFTPTVPTDMLSRKSTIWLTSGLRSR